MKKAVILAGGRGIRLYPYTSILPKPLLPIDNYPILEIVLRQLKRDGFKDIVLCVGYLASLIRAYFGDGKKFGVRIRYSEEDSPLGTAGPMSLVEGLDDDFLLMNGDILTDLDYGDFFRSHLEHGCLATVAVCQRRVAVSLGTIKLNKERYITNYVEKPNLNYYASMGIYAFQKEILAHIKHNSFLNIPDLIKILLKKKEAVSGYLYRGLWLDIGRPEDYKTAVEIFIKKRKQFLG